MAAAWVIRRKHLPISVQRHQGKPWACHIGQGAPYHPIPPSWSSKQINTTSNIRVVNCCFLVYYSYVDLPTAAHLDLEIELDVRRWSTYWTPTLPRCSALHLFIGVVRTCWNTRVIFKGGMKNCCLIDMNNNWVFVRSKCGSSLHWYSGLHPKQGYCMILVPT